MNTQAIEKKLQVYFDTATPEQIVKEFEDLGVEFVQTKGPVEILKKYGAIPTDWRHCLQELEEYYNIEEQLEEQKRKTALAMLNLFEYMVRNVSDINWKQKLLYQIKDRQDELTEKD